MTLTILLVASQEPGLLVLSTNPVLQACCSATFLVVLRSVMVPSPCA